MDVKQVSNQTKCALKEVEILLQQRNQMLIEIQLKYSVRKRLISFLSWDVPS